MYIFIIVLSTLLDIVASPLLKESDDFKNKIWGLAAIVNAILTFFLLSFSLKYAPLSTAYSTWGAMGIIGTCLGGWILCKEKLNKVGTLGIIIVIITIFLLNY